ncbi:hypothetical protein SAMN06269185_2278 [Natronoarchaeum philippinense]|uniref:Uncharacterized protein n=1 Tax=Natronoarchaeum philippinense TaxID=558529 RepID=A0A285NZD5_NATPI|nr:hypothetical protein [Natronoarchaeum philippinense]SNZ14854.1 hypothetical protein SAMN06269185_2278 [Natronoarchaeum philippinense]
MDRISALRNVEDALAAFEDGEADLDRTERRVLGVLRTYATEYESAPDAAYRVETAERADALIVVAASPDDARERVADLLDEPIEPTAIERLDD